MDRQEWRAVAGITVLLWVVADCVFEVGSRQRCSYGNDNATFARLPPEMAKGRPFFGTPSKCRVAIRFLGVNTAL
jgi:hypothetical protein